jgi:predicted kinase
MFDVTETKNYPDISESFKEEIKEIYRKQVKIPNSKPKRRFLLCPVGLVAAGKTTVIKSLAEKLDLVRISTDEIRKILKEHGFNYQGTKEIAYDLVKEYAEKGHSVAIDGNCGTENTIDRIKKAEKEYELPAIWVRVKPPEDFILNKLRDYKHTWLFKNSDEAIGSYFEYKNKHSNLDNLKLNYVYTFDTSKNDLAEQIETAAKIIKKLTG